MQVVAGGRVREGDTPPLTAEHRSYNYDAFPLNPMYMLNLATLFRSIFQTQGR